ncbi:hypothetical protein SCATT_19120 [Streptantibioticus cattleyicolor NRRL 8057 = DSM 46488]|uniref:Class E sortase n=1 Tax=Streptantibioticus cattleyicolor (strain ATCC 35852 / DSM 46488 / JCM 4925 / NBRC 14057 / NRRL 8057) TaxID=1003195 RepID=G8WTT8_STREN|nr:hypothetical protein SCATT_19120 [Streptantibioticus cattleyicolor NRRL 8057 = DSM 46488]
MLWALGEAAVTIGAVVLLLVVHALWWTNAEAEAGARHEVAALERDWDARPSAAPGATPPPSAGPDRGGPAPSPAGHHGTAGGPAPGDPRPGSGYAVIRVPAIGLTAPIAEGTDKATVLNLGYVGHYPGTAEPGQPGNVALAGHRNTHGEPFRHLDRVRPGDTVLIETADARYTYAVEQTVPQTSPYDGTVIAPVPYSGVHPERRMTGAGYYLTLTTCTPEFTSRYRLVVWARLRAEEPRRPVGAR